ncbi:MAG: hypothetical protein C4297_06185 [Gemmataceae bacterium]
MPRVHVGLLGLLAWWCLAASYATPNFVVEAPTPAIAQQVAQFAERYRREKALQWLGQEMPTWGKPCPVRVTLTLGGSGGGATSFAFDRGAILHQEMHIEGPLDRILYSVLPHEITHTVFAYYFRAPVPRWADEGGSVLSEDEPERRRHDMLVRQSLAGGRAFRLRYLFNLKEYPSLGNDILTLYAQGYSVSRYLVETKGHRGFLLFVGDGMRQGWDYAVQNQFGFQRVEDLEEAWLRWMRQAHFAPTQLAGAKRPAAQPPAVQLLPPVVRGAEPDEPPAPPGSAAGLPLGSFPAAAPRTGRPPSDSAPRVAGGSPPGSGPTTLAEQALRYTAPIQVPVGPQR